MTPLPRLRLSANGHFLETETGTPFFWLGDTAWNLFHRLSQEEAAHYLTDRQRKGFTLIQAVALMATNPKDTNAYGDPPILETNPLCPNEAYFQNIDAVLDLAEQRGLYVGFLPTWGEAVFHYESKGQTQAIFNIDQAHAYGQWVGRRYRERTNLVWILGGDRPAVWPAEWRPGQPQGPDFIDFRPVWRAMAQGIQEGCGYKPLMTYHPMGLRDSSQWLNDEAWLDMHMMQSCHDQPDVPAWDWVTHDYALTPTRPTLDGEPNYEDHPINPFHPTWNPRSGYFRDYDVRKQSYRSVFAGACGITYGHHAVWQFYSPAHKPINYPDRYWIEALNRPGASQMQHLRRLIESRPYLTRVPDQGLLISDHGIESRHVRATRDNEGRYAFVYLPFPMPVTINLAAITGPSITAWWYDPITGVAELIGVQAALGEQTFSPPGHRPDWVLVLDSTAQNFSPPGQLA